MPFLSTWRSVADGNENASVIERLVQVTTWRLMSPSMAVMTLPSCRRMCLSRVNLWLFRLAICSIKVRNLQHDLASLVRRTAEHLVGFSSLIQGKHCSDPGL